MLHVIAIDDHPMFLNGFANVLHNLPLVSSVAIYTSHSQLMSDMPGKNAHIAFIDLKMPDKDGFSNRGI